MELPSRLVNTEMFARHIDQPHGAINVLVEELDLKEEKPRTAWIEVQLSA